MPKDPNAEPKDGEDSYQPAALNEPQDADEDAQIRRIEEAEQRESRREILLGQIAVARNALYAAEEAGDTAEVAALRQRIDALTRERNGL